MTSSLSPLMTVPEAVSYLKTSRAGLYRMIDQGDLPRPLRRGGRALFARHVVERYAQREIDPHHDWELGL
jgi:excisionase family DNA binding protein